MYVQLMSDMYSSTKNKKYIQHTGIGKEKWQEEALISMNPSEQINPK